MEGRSWDIWGPDEPSVWVGLQAHLVSSLWRAGALYGGLEESRVFLYYWALKSPIREVFLLAQALCFGRVQLKYTLIT